jgi:hypothetical protein
VNIHKRNGRLFDALFFGLRRARGFEPGRGKTPQVQAIRAIAFRVTDGKKSGNLRQIAGFAEGTILAHWSGESEWRSTPYDSANLSNPGCANFEERRTWAEMYTRQHERAIERIEDRETRGFKFCHVCQAEARKTTDKFCRRCGARQIYDTERFTPIQRSSSLTARAAEFPTAPVPLRQLSGSLLTAVTEEISARASTRLKNRYAKGLFLALLSILIWLMMVLLAPIDALIAARGIAHYSFFGKRPAQMINQTTQN